MEDKDVALVFGKYQNMVSTLKELVAHLGKVGKIDH
jgi:hypothetical protein